MRNFLRAFWCHLTDHQEATTIEHGWAVTTCRRCGEVGETWWVGKGEA